jgi:hypothetical protein
MAERLDVEAGAEAVMRRVVLPLRAMIEELAAACLCYEDGDTDGARRHVALAREASARLGAQPGGVWPHDGIGDDGG